MEQRASCNLLLHKGLARCYDARILPGPLACSRHPTGLSRGRTKGGKGILFEGPFYRAAQVYLETGILSAEAFVGSRLKKKRTIPRIDPQP